MTMSIQPTTLKDMIIAGDNHVDIQEDICIHFSISVSGPTVEEYEFKVFEFKRPIFSEEVVDQIINEDVQNPWQPARIEHLLYFGNKIPGEKHRFRVYALGSTARIHGSVHVPSLDVPKTNRRKISKSLWCYQWRLTCRFLAVRFIRK